MKFERTSSNSLSPLGAQNKDIGFSLTLLTEFKLCLWRMLYGGAILVSAAFPVLRVFTYKGLKAARWRLSECPGYS